MNTDALIEALKANEAAGYVPPPASALPPACHNWPAPLALLEPHDTAAIGDIVRQAESANAAIVICGGGTKLHIGPPPNAEKPCLLLRTVRCNRLLDYTPDDLTVTCEPGMTLGALQQILAEKNQMLALDAPLREQSTLGGIVSANTSGFWRGTHGTARDLLIGLRAVMTGGGSVRGGGKVVKNVAGYDVCKLFTGAWGTLGIVTELTFKVRALPPARLTVGWEMPDGETAATAGLALHSARLAPLFLLVARESDGPPRLLAGFEGPPERIQWQSGEFARRVGLAGIAETRPAPVSEAELAMLRDGTARLGPATNLAARISVLTAALPGFLRLLERLNVRYTACCMSGVVSIGAEGETAETVAAIRAVLPAESYCVWARLPDGATAETWGAARGDFALHRALKQSLDPQETFAPGRFVGGI